MEQQEQNQEEEQEEEQWVIGGANCDANATIDAS